MRGMSLIELLVVVAVLAVIAGIATVGLLGSGGERQVEREARRLQALVTLACERAQLSGREHGLQFAQARYGFSLAGANGWRSIDSGPLVVRELPQGFVLQVSRDGRALELERDFADEPQSLCAPGGELVPFEARISSANVPAWQVVGAADGSVRAQALDSAP
jgi:general secretion pathway protein H